MEIVTSGHAAAYHSQITIRAVLTSVVDRGPNVTAHLSSAFLYPRPDTNTVTDRVKT